MSSWTRPSSVPFPFVWSRFEGRKEINGKIPRFWIQDIPEDEVETVINIMVDGFLDDEPICKYSQVSSEKESVEEFRQVWKEILKDKLGLICYMENPDPAGKPIIAAMNCTHIMLKDKPFKPSKAKKSFKLMSTLEYLCKMNDAFKMLEIDSFLNAMGLYVLPPYRGQGLGLKLLQAREPLCRATGITASLTAFTATASQILAARAGFKDLSVISYEDLQKANPLFRYPGIEKDSIYLKYMYILYK